MSLEIGLRIRAVLVLIFLSGCDFTTEGQGISVVATPSEKAVKSATPIALPTPTTPPPPATATATATPYPPLSPQGPYLIYRKSFDASQFIIVNADGSGRRLIQLSQIEPVIDLRRAISPDGKWLAYHSASQSSKFALTLNLYSIPEGISRKVASFVSNEYCLNTFAWSPDGTLLAFIGQLDTSYFDLYLYNTQTETLTMLTADPAIACSVQWSPDGQWLLYENIVVGQERHLATLHRTKPESAINQYPQTLEAGHWWYGDAWASPGLLFIFDRGDGGSDYDLRYLDVEAGKVHSMWADTYETYAVDIENELIALSSSPSGQGLTEPVTGDGLYMLSLDGIRHKVSKTIYWSLTFRGGTKSRFIGNDGRQIVGIAVDGAITPLFTLADEWWSVTRMGLSPNRRWFVLYNDAGKGLLLFSDTDSLVSKWDEFKPALITWRPDSTGLFFRDSARLYYLSIPDGEPTLIDECQSDDLGCGFGESYFAWLP